MTKSTLISNALTTIGGGELTDDYSDAYYGITTIEVVKGAKKSIYDMAKNNKDMVRRLLDVCVGVTAYRLLPTNVIADVTKIHIDTITDAQLSNDGGYALFCSLVAKNQDAILDAMTDNDFQKVLNAHGTWIGTIKDDNGTAFQIWKTKLA